MESDEKVEIWIQEAMQLVTTTTKCIFLSYEQQGEKTILFHFISGSEQSSSNVLFHTVEMDFDSMCFNMISDYRMEKFESYDVYRLLQRKRKLKENYFVGHWRGQASFKYVKIWELLWKEEFSFIRSVILKDKTVHLKPNCDLFSSQIREKTTYNIFTLRCGSCGAPIVMEWNILNYFYHQELWKLWSFTNSFLYWIPEEVLKDIFLFF
jgi:hypothetical protein